MLCNLLNEEGPPSPASRDLHDMMAFQKKSLTKQPINEVLLLCYAVEHRMMPTTVERRGSQLEEHEEQQMAGVGANPERHEAGASLSPDDD
jgi:hypothetical protein